MELDRAEKRFRLTTHDYARLAQFRYVLRSFSRFSEATAEAVGLTSQHYQAMLILRAAADSRVVTINDLAHELLIKHNSAVGLVDRLGTEGLMERARSMDDRRKVELRLTGRGREVLAQLAAAHRSELQQLGTILTDFFSEISGE